ncbi:MAG: polysulfide reductase NrfD, partial [Verrucomicrobia bacterium]|nr:polysulfide reductase NrfD [Verrucomicrobiota bacterium]
IVAPRFLASAFAAGPALLIITFQFIRKMAHFTISNESILLLRKIITVAMLVNIFLLGCEAFTEFYSGTYHVVSAQYLFMGLHGHDQLVPWIWAAISMNLVAMILLVLPISQKLGVLNIACLLLFVGIWIEKGMGLIIPGFVPTPLGQVVEYQPTLNETLVCMGIWAFGALVYSWMLRMAIPILKGQLSASTDRA